MFQYKGKRWPFLEMALFQNRQLINSNKKKEEYMDTDTGKQVDGVGGGSLGLELEEAL